MRMNTTISSENSTLNDGTLFVTFSSGKMTCQLLEAGGTVEIDSCEAHKYRELERAPLQYFPSGCGCDCHCDESDDTGGDTGGDPDNIEEFAVCLTEALNNKN
jgi:hypothetical protein